MYLFSYRKKSHASLHVNMPVQFYKEHPYMKFSLAYKQKRRRIKKCVYSWQICGFFFFPEADCGEEGL